MQRVSWDAFLSIFWAIRCMALNLAATVSNCRVGQDSAAEQQESVRSGLGGGSN